MPNWCANAVSLSIGEDTTEEGKELFNLIMLNQGKNFCNLVIPVPEELVNPEASTFGGDDAAKRDELRSSLKEKYGYESWYDFCVSEWGTKWDVHELTYDPDSNTYINLYFDTAWSPPVGVYQKLEELGVNVEASYIEQGCAFIGYYSSTKGEETLNFNEVYGEYLDEADFESQDEFYYALNQQEDLLLEWFDTKGLPTPAHFGG